MSSTITEILLLSAISLVSLSCSSEKRVEVEYICSLGHTHREVVRHSDSSYRMGSQIECIPGEIQ